MPRWPWQSQPVAEAAGLRDARAIETAVLRDWCARHAVDAALIAEHVEALGWSPSGREHVLVRDGGPGEIESLCWTGGNLVPLGFDATGLDLLAAELRRRHRRYSSIVGPADQVLGLWERSRGFLPAPRDVRPNQPSMTITAPSPVAPDPLVVPTAPEDAGVLLPASVAMFTEEVGYSPLSVGGGYERRVRSLVSTGRSLSRIEEGPNGREVVFKADLGTVGLGVTQVQGVWVNPRHRGRGLAAPAMAAVVNHALAHVAPTVSLYVNSYNERALATYRRVGFDQVGTFATVLF